MKITDEEARRLSPPGCWIGRVCDNCRRLLTRSLTYMAGDREYCSNICLETAEGRRGAIPRKDKQMIESENNPKTETQEDSAGEKKANAETKNKSMKGGGKNKTAPKGTDEPKPDKPVKKAAKKAAKKPDKPVKKAAKKAAKKADKPVKKAAKKAAKGDKPKAAAPKGQKVEGNPYRPGSAFFQIFERFRAKPKTKIALVDLFKGVDFPDQSRMLAHMKGHGETGERGVKFKLERVEGGFIIYTPR